MPGSHFNPNYWEQRYRKGWNSGKGSRGLYRAWKWRIIQSHLQKPVSLSTFIDLGCGDHSFWKGRKSLTYLGLDKSPTIINKNRTKWPNKEWRCWDVTEPAPVVESYDAALVMDVLFHVEELDDARSILRNAGSCAEFVFARNWNTDLRRGRPDDYQAYHNNLDLVDAIPTHQFWAMHTDPWYADNGSSVLVWKRRDTLSHSNRQTLEGTNKHD